MSAENNSPSTSSSTSSGSVLQNLDSNKIILPVMISLGVLIFLMIKDFDINSLQSIDWGWMSLVCLIIAALLMVVRHYALMTRLKVLLDHKLSWWQSFQLISLWEFGSAVTPSTVGGTAVALFLITKEKIRAGETIAVVLFTIFLDGCFFLLGIPFLWMWLGNGLLHPALAGYAYSSGALALILPFVMAYVFMVVYTIMIGYGLFVNPRSLKWLMVRTTKLPLLRRFKEGAMKTGDEMIIASKELRKKGRQFWAVGIITTIVNWGTRFLVLNFVMLAFMSIGDHLLLFGRQLIIYIMMILAPTPGGSGVAELTFGPLLNDFFAQGGGVADKGLQAVIIPIWRLISYVPFLILGLFVMPAWMRRVFGNTKTEEVQAELESMSESEADSSNKKLKNRPFKKDAGSALPS